MYEGKNHIKYSLIVCFILLRYSLADSVSSIVKDLKQYTTYCLRKTEDNFPFKYIYGSRRFWSRGYFAYNVDKFYKMLTQEAEICYNK